MCREVISCLGQGKPADSLTLGCQDFDDGQEQQRDDSEGKEDWGRERDWFPAMLVF